MDLILKDMHSFFLKIQFGVEMPGGCEGAAQLRRAELAHAATKQTTSRSRSTSNFKTRIQRHT